MKPFSFASMFAALLAVSAIALAQQSWDFTGLVVKMSAEVSSGAPFTLSGGTGACATTSTIHGGPTAGNFLCTGTAGASTIVVGLPTLVAPQTGWTCQASDETAGTGWAQSAHSVNSATLKGTITTTSDMVSFGCSGY